MLEFAEDMAIDIPKIYTYLGELISPMVEDGSIPLSFLKTTCEPLFRCNKAGLLVAEILHDASNRLVSKFVVCLAASFCNWETVLYDYIFHRVRSHKFLF